MPYRSRKKANKISDFIPEYLNILNCKNSKILVAYFTASGITGGMAHNIADCVNADLYEIEPKYCYTREDISYWESRACRAAAEMYDENCRPELADFEADIASYDTIALCFPIWCCSAPKIINSFLESYDFSGKRIVLYATSDRDGFEKAYEAVKGSVNDDVKISEGAVKICCEDENGEIKEVKTIIYN